MMTKVSEIPTDMLLHRHVCTSMVSWMHAQRDQFHFHILHHYSILYIAYIFINANDYAAAFEALEYAVAEMEASVDIDELPVRNDQRFRLQIYDVDG